MSTADTIPATVLGRLDYPLREYPAATPPRKTFLAEILLPYKKQTVHLTPDELWELVCGATSEWQHFVCKVTCIANNSFRGATATIEIFEIIDD